jgi:Family of unknown function (DUF6455)
MSRRCRTARSVVPWKPSSFSRYRVGLSPAEAAAQESRGLAYAVRRCTLCPSVDACREWLASGSREGLERFCPNASLIERLIR